MSTKVSSTKKKPAAKKPAAKSAAAKSAAKKTVKAPAEAPKAVETKKKSNKAPIIIFCSVLGVLLVGLIVLIPLVIIPTIMGIARSGVYCEDGDEDASCITVDGDKIDFGTELMSTRSIVATIKGDKVVFSEEDKEAYNKACKASWFCWTGDLEDMPIEWGEDSFEIGNATFIKKGNVVTVETTSGKDDEKTSTSKIDDIKDSGKNAGDSKIFHLAKGSYSLRYTITVDWADYTGSLGFEDVSIDIRDCSGSSSYCSYEKGFYTDYYHQDKNETVKSKTEKFEISDDGDYKLEISDEYADGMKVKSWEITISQL